MDRPVPTVMLLFAVIAVACGAAKLNAQPMASNDSDFRTYGESGAALALVTATEGGSCLNPTGASRTGAVAFTSNGLLLTCQSGSWKSLFDSSEIANPGYTRLPSGLIIQYGSFGDYSTGGFSGAKPPKVIFRKPFTTACISASGTHMMGYIAASAATYAAIVSCDKTGIQFDATVPGRHWMAIGY